jgi:hypothetical protein
MYYSTRPVAPLHAPDVLPSNTMPRAAWAALGRPRPPAAQPQQFDSGIWSCCGETHTRPAGLSARQQDVYASLHPHVTDWTETSDPVHTELRFGIGQHPLDRESR